MTDLPTEKALREMRELTRKNIPDGAWLELIDCALTLRRLERWLRDGPGEPPRKLTVFDVGGGMFDAALFNGQGEGAAGYAPNGPDLLAAFAAALDKAEVGK